MTRELTAAHISNLVYQACALYEELERKGKVRGNGHHMAQEVAKYAHDLLIERWVEEDVKCESQQKP